MSAPPLPLATRMLDAALCLRLLLLELVLCQALVAQPVTLAASSVQTKLRQGLHLASCRCEGFTARRSSRPRFRRVAPALCTLLPARGLHSNPLSQRLPVAAAASR